MIHSTYFNGRSPNMTPLKVSALATESCSMNSTKAKRVGWVSSPAMRTNLTSPTCLKNSSSCSAVVVCGYAVEGRRWAAMKPNCWIGGWVKGRHVPESWGCRRTRSSWFRRFWKGRRCPWGVAVPKPRLRGPDWRASGSLWGGSAERHKQVHLGPENIHYISRRFNFVVLFVCYLF